MARASESPSAPAYKHKLRVPKARRGTGRVLVGTRKGIFRIDVDERRESFTLLEPTHLGSTAFHVVADPRDRRHVLAAIRTPEGRPTIVVSEDGGERWVECSRPPAFGQPAEDDPTVWERTVNQVFWLTPGHGSEYRTYRNIAQGPVPVHRRRAHLGRGRRAAPLSVLRRMVRARRGRHGWPQAPSVLITQDAGSSAARDDRGRKCSSRWTAETAGSGSRTSVPRARPPRTLHEPHQPRRPLDAEPLRCLPDGPGLRREWRRVGPRDQRGGFTTRVS